ncbi:MAG: triple tyrosine motif-containing protein [Bacteroidota bacterium]
MHQLSGQKFPEKGLPPLQNYTPEEYAQAGKVWAIQSAANGLVYFATDKGLLEFDGLNWRRYSGSKGFTRSLLVVNDSVIYTGADKDFGVWERNGIQGFHYRSCYPFRESTQGLNEEFWGVYQIEDEIIFVSFDNLYVQKEGQLTKVAAPTRFSKSFQAGGALYLADEQRGLFHFDGLSLRQVFEYPERQTWQIMGLDETEEGLYIVTRDQGLFAYREESLVPLQQEVGNFLRQDQVFSFSLIEDSHYAFGTILNGVYITDRRGRIIQQINKQKGILNNTMLSLHYSPQGSLWLGMDFGIAALRLSSEVAYVLDHQGVFGTGQTALLDGEAFYLGTNQGLYFSAWEGLKNNTAGIAWSLIPESAGQVWALQNIGGIIWCGHDQGLFQVSPQRFVPIYQDEGILAISPLGDRHLVAGTYNGLSLFQRQGQSWTFEGKIAPVQGACSQVMAAGDSLLWVNIPNFGIIKAHLTENLQIERQRFYLYETFEGETPWLYQDSSGLHLSTNLYAYSYNQGQDSFLREATPLNTEPVLNRLATRWSGVALDQEFQFFPVYNGFALINHTPQESIPQPAQVLVRSLMAFNNDTSIGIAGYSEIPHHLNNLRIQFLVPHQEHTLYRYRLANFQDQWSDWSEQNSRDFLNLSGGEYELLVEAKSLGGLQRSQPVMIKVLPPWYRRWYMYLAVALLLFGLYYLQRLRNQRKLGRLQAQLEAKELQARAKQEEVFLQEKMVQAQQRLEGEIADLKKRLRAKTIELAKKGKENEDKNRLLQTLRDKISAIEKSRSVEPSRRWAEMGRLLDHKLGSEDHTFEMQIDELNQDFLRRLKASYPALTTYDLRLATYLKMGLSSREIAELLNVLPSSVNVSRSRLRKKLNLDAERDLYEFLIEV